MKQLAPLFACAGLAACASFPAPAPPISVDDLVRRIETLADDRFAGREPASPEGEAAADWIAQEMAAIGLEPAGENGTFFQAVPLVRSTLDEAASSLTLAGPRGLAVSLSFGDDTVFWTKKTDPDLAFADSGLVFVGYGAVAPEYGWDDYAGLDVRGKTVVMLVNDPGYATGDPELFTGRAMTYYGRWTYKFEEAGRQGATAAIIVHETAPASYGWDVVEGSWTDAQFDLVRPDGGASRAALEGWVTREAAERLFAAAGLDFETMKAAAQERGFRPTPMGNLRASGRVVSDIVEMSSRNVAGLVRGTERPDEVVLMTAHWDHLGDRDVPPGEDGVYNGAVDNATGVAAILEIAEALAANPPERSVMALAVTAEESGLLGSEYFGESPLVPLAHIVGGLNIDALLPVGRARDIVVVGYGASELEDILARHAATAGKTLTPDPNPEAGYFYRSDHISLSKRGVPMLYADSGEDLLEGGAAAGAAAQADYRDNRYHGPADEYDAATWDFSGIVEMLTIDLAVVRDLADSDDWPNWYEGNEFRALRDAQRAGAD
jgi:Zn-dependent M28 family amino/carboxypeptidase